MYLHGIAENSAFAEQSTSYVAGKVTGMLLASIAGAWIVFKVAKDSRRAASIALPVIFGIALSSSLKSVATEIREERAAQASLLSDIENAETPEEKMLLAKKLINEVAPEFAPLIDALGIEAARYTKSAEDVLSERFLDFDRLAASEGLEEYQLQRSIAKEHVERCTQYLAALETTLSGMDRVGGHSKGTNQFRAGFKVKVAPMVPFVRADLKLVELYRQLLVVLEAEHGKWVSNETENVFESEEAQARYDALFATVIVASEARDALIPEAAAQ